MPRVAIRPSKEVAALLRQRRQALKLSLRDAERRSSTYGKLIPFSTLGKVEQGKVDPGILRLQQLLRVYDIPASVALELADIENLTGDMPKGGTPEHLFEEGLRFWKMGEVGKALGHLHALRRAVAGREEHTELRHKAELQFATVAGTLGRYHFAKELLEKLVTEDLPPRLRLHVLVQLARCWEQLGVQELALALLARAEVHGAGATARDRACIAQEHGQIAYRRGQYDLSREKLEEAVELYRKADDQNGVIGSTFSLTRLLLAKGEPDAALRSARKVLSAIADGEATSRHRPQAHVLVGHALLASGKVEEAVTALRTALGEAITADEPVARFLAHHYLGHAYRELGEHKRALEEDQAAAQFRKYSDFEPDPVVVKGGQARGAPAQHRVDQRQRRRRSRSQSR